MGKKLTQTTVRFTEESWNRLSEVADANRITVPQLIREIVEIYFDKWLEAQEAKLEILRKQGIVIPMIDKPLYAGLTKPTRVTEKKKQTDL